MTVPRTIEKMFHFAFPCRDAEETRAFYEDIIGLPMTSAVKDRKSTRLNSSHT